MAVPESPPPPHTLTHSPAMGTSEANEQRKIPPPSEPSMNWSGLSGLKARAVSPASESAPRPERRPAVRGTWSAISWNLTTEQQDSDYNSSTHTAHMVNTTRHTQGIRNYYSPHIEHRVANKYCKTSEQSHLHSWRRKYTNVEAQHRRLQSTRLKTCNVLWMNVMNIRQQQ